MGRMVLVGFDEITNIRLQVYEVPCSKRGKKRTHAKSIYGEMVDFAESDKMIKISGKVDKSNTYNRFSGYISFFIHGRTSSD